MAIVKIENKDQFLKELKTGKVLIDFYADWCGPCKMMEPVIRQVEAEDESLKVLKVNVDEQQELAMDYQIMSIPTLMVFNNGEMTQKAIGLQPKQKLEELVK